MKIKVVFTLIGERISDLLREQEADKGFELKQIEINPNQDTIKTVVTLLFSQGLDGEYGMSENFLKEIMKYKHKVLALFEELERASN